MKNSIIVLAITALLFAGCDTKDSYGHGHEHDSEGGHTKSESVHKHSGGLVHEDHKDNEHTQEEFKVNTDSSHIEVEEQGHGHSHEDGSHKH